MARFGIALILALALAGCSDANEPGSGVSGTYEATTETLVQNGVTTDALAAGLTISMTLTAAGTTSGTMHVPASLGEDGTAEDRSLTGTWSFDADSTHVTFDHDADTVIRDITWAVGNSTLSGSFVGDIQNSLSITLTRQD